MKRAKNVRTRCLYLSLSCMFLLLIMHIVTAHADPFLIFRPGPGLNDGTDDGTINAGKDAFL